MAKQGLGLTNPCEWDPANKRPAQGHYDDRTREWTNYEGCRNPAEILVGAKGQWRLCQHCAVLPEFRRFRKRRRIEQRHTWIKVDFMPHESCAKCGVVRRADGKNSPCRGIVLVTLRDGVPL